MSKEILAIIPCRGGSKRLPGKNLMCLEGESLLSRTVNQARQSVYITRLVVSTEDADIETEARLCGAEVIKRPSVLAQDDTPMLPVIQHVLNHLEKYEEYKPIIVAILQVTSPLRTVTDIDTTIDKLIMAGADSAETQCNGKENGTCYVSRRYVITEQNQLLGKPLVIHEMPPERSVDINTIEDFQEAERILKGEKNDNRGVLHELGRLGHGAGNDKGRKRGRPRKSG